MPSRKTAAASPSTHHRGRGPLVLVVGPSGVGKDTLIDYCRTRLSDEAIVFPRRSITRPTGDGFEDHDSIGEADFARKAADNAFAIHWRAHGLCYGVPASIDQDLAMGRTVVVNVSRSVIETVRSRYRPLVVISVTADRAVVAERLVRRSRETRDDIDRRLLRGDIVRVAGDDVIRLDNSGTVEDAGEAMLRLLIGGNR